MYSPQVLDHFEHPRNPGILEPADVSVQVENPACGDVLKLTANLAEGRIAEASAKGCVPAIACGSALTELLIGKTLKEAATLSREDLLRKLGSLPQASAHASHLGMDALAQLLARVGLPTLNDGRR